MDGNENIFAETFGYNTNAFESSVKCIEEQQALNEAMFSISSDGKKIKKSIKEKCKEMRKREGFFDGAKKSFSKAYDESKIKELDSFIKSLSNKCYISPILKTITTTYVNTGCGIMAPHTTVNYSKDYIFTKGSKVYSAHVGLYGNGCTLVYFCEVDLEAKKNLMSKELINDILSVLSSIQANGFISENKVSVVKGVTDSKKTQFVNKIEQLVNKKYPDLKVSTNVFTGNIKFKKNK